jgi:SAM-dependent methyltransferase
MRETSFGEKNIGLVDKLIFLLRKRQFRSALSGKIDLAIDLGSGHRARLLRALLASGDIRRGHAVDLSLDHAIFTSTLTGEEHDLNTGVVSLPDESADLVVSLAIIEHLIDPVHHVKEAFRLLCPGKKLILTTPSPYGKPVLEFLAYKLHVIDEGEIRDHKHYFRKCEIDDLLKLVGFQNVTVEHFLFGLNTIAIGEKPT